MDTMGRPAGPAKAANALPNLFADAAETPPEMTPAR